MHTHTHTHTTELNDRSDRDLRSWDPGPPPWGRWSINKKKFLQDTSPNTHTAATTRKLVVTPPPPPTIKGVPRCNGGTGVKIQKNHWGIILGPEMMILQGVRRQNPYIGVCYAKEPKKGGYTMLAPALDLSTSLQGDLPNHFRIFPELEAGVLCVAGWGGPTGGSSGRGGGHRWHFKYYSIGGWGGPPKPSCQSLGRG